MIFYEISSKIVIFKWGVLYGFKKKIILLYNKVQMLFFFL